MTLKIIFSKTAKSTLTKLSVNHSLINLGLSVNEVLKPSI